MSHGNGNGRLDAYGRYARILAAQLEALEGKEPDIDRFHDLARERDHLAREIDRLNRPLPDLPESRRLEGKLRETLEECRRTDAAILQRLDGLREETARAVHAMDDRRNGRNRYLAPAGGDAGGTQVDLRS